MTGELELVAATDSIVLILGETGTGKELVARAIHRRSAQRERADYGELRHAAAISLSASSSVRSVLPAQCISSFPAAAARASRGYSAIDTAFHGRAARKLGKPFEGLAPDFLDHAMRYDWPGNVRELENFVERAAILSRGAMLEVRGVFTAPIAPVASTAVPPTSPKQASKTSSGPTFCTPWKRRAG